jgi:hypothetical protein
VARRRDGHWIEDAMSHDKIRAAARRRMAETGEPYAAARRAVIEEHQAAGGQSSSAGGEIPTARDQIPPAGEQTAPAGDQTAPVRDQIPPDRAKWFAISYSDDWSGRLTDSLDRLLFRAGRGVSGVEVDAGQIRVRMGSFKLDIPRSSVRAVRLSQARVRGTTGVHGSRGRWLVNGSAEGLVEVTIDPPSNVAPSIDTLFGLGPSRVNQLTVSLEDPAGFIAAVQPEGNATGPSSMKK